MGNLNKIRISRSKYIENDRSAAVLRLDMADHLAGQLVMVRYYTSGFKDKVDTLLAIGIKDGQGKDCYRILTLGGLNLVRDVSYVLPDVSALVHGELYLWYSPDTLRWCYVYLNNGRRIIEPITGGPYVFSCIENNIQYYFDPSDDTLVKEFDFIEKNKLKDDLACIRSQLGKAREELDKISTKINYYKIWVKDIDNEVFPVKVQLTSLTGNIFKMGSSESIKIRVFVEKNNRDITKECSFTLDGNEIYLDSNNEFSIDCLDRSKEIVLIATFKPNEDNIFTGVGKTVINFGNIFYYGSVSANWICSENNIKMLSNNILQINNDIEYITSLNNQKIAFICPSCFGKLNHIYDDSGLDYINDYSITNFWLDNTDYYVYLKKDEVMIDNFKQKFIYKK